MFDLSIVVPTYNRLETLQHVVPSLLAQSIAPERYEIIVADSKSTDGTAEYLAAQPRVRHLPGAYTGRASARNAGIAAASGRIVLFNDSDIIASPDLLERHLARHERVRCAVVGLEVQVRSYDEYLAKSKGPPQRDTLHPPTRKRLSWLYFLTGNASVPKRDLDAVGGFDESFTGYGHEDLELGYRLEASGVRIVYEPKAVNFHVQDVGFEDQKSKMELAGRSTVRFYRKHPAFVVRLRLGMTPLSLGVHTLLERTPAIRDWLERRSATWPLARTIAYQYHYVTGIKAALSE